MKVFWKNMNGNLCVPLFIKRVRPLKSRPPWPEAVRMIASLGGFLGRKGDGEPGVKTIWLLSKVKIFLPINLKTCVFRIILA